MIAQLLPVRIGVFCTYFFQNALNFVLGRQGKLFSGWIGHVKDDAAKRTWKLIQREGIRMFFEKAPDLCLFPSPTLT